MKPGYVIWPEGQPERARFAQTWLGKQWLMVGPMGLRASLALRRMTCCWPSHRNENPEHVARGMECLMFRGRVRR